MSSGTKYAGEAIGVSYSCVGRQVVPVLRLPELGQSLQFLWRPALRSMQRIEACAVGREDRAAAARGRELLPSRVYLTESPLTSGLGQPTTDL